MKKKFSSLPIGADFYPPDKNGEPDLTLKYMKVYPLRITIGSAGEAMAITPNVVMSEGLINCVISEGPASLKGYFEFVPQDQEVYHISKENTLIC